MAQCRNCKYYPNDCGYWNKKKRSSNATYVMPYTIHGCLDFIKRRVVNDKKRNS